MFTDATRGAAEEPVALALAGKIPGVTVIPHRFKLSPLEERFTSRLRLLCDVLHYEHPDFADALWLRDRAWEAPPPGVARWARRIARCGRKCSRWAISAALALDRVVAPPAIFDTFLEAEDPDVLLASPVVWGLSAQIELLKAASRRGTPTGILIPSWDNLTTKGFLGYVPDRVFVWNEMQRAELERLHRTPAGRVTVTGAPTFDHWFTASRVQGREAFLERVGLDPTQPYVLYLSSSWQIAPEEPDFFERWLGVIRSSPDEVVRDVQVLVRPHPVLHTQASWYAREFERLPHVSVWPLDADALAQPEYYSDYENSLRHCAAAIGLNTSSMVEAAIFAKPVCTWEDGSLGERLRQTPHYGHLRTAGGAGLLHVATNAAQHVEQLGQAIRQGVAGMPDPQSLSFAEAFIRPRGLDHPVAPFMADELVRLGREQSRVDVPGPIGRRVGKTVERSHYLLGLPLQDHPIRSIMVRLVAEIVFLRARPKGKAEARRMRAAAEIERQKQRARARKDAQKAQKLHAAAELEQRMHAAAEIERQKREGREQKEQRRRAAVEIQEQKQRARARKDAQKAQKLRAAAELEQPELEQPE
ncbi:MAG TPA: hypothetical protein VNJ54_02235 [Plantibacter sp.]|uniref:hypothetical protein n=1 Tax=Plantibacter sp. TaxID=1871045 RepID=UPI002CA88B9A|nr:hypothetical protein [Plantibacter sp.]